MAVFLNIDMDIVFCYTITMKNKYGHGQNEKYPVGAVVLRERIKRKEPPRAYIKIASPSVWILFCRWQWGKNFGQIPPQMGIHHKDGNRLNDSIENLELVSKAQHLELHRPEFKDRALASFIAARRRLRWSTKKKVSM